MQQAYRLAFPLPPTVNHYYGSKGRIRYLSKAGKLFRAEVAAVWADTVKGLGAVPLDGTLAVKVVLHAGDSRRWDIDNRIKALLDAMQHAGMFDDDFQINDLHVVRGENHRGAPSCVVEIAEIG